jgi:hypothetical protein
MFPGTIDGIDFRPIEGNVAFFYSAEYVDSRPAGRLYTDSVNYFLPDETFEGLDTVHVDVSITGSLWRIHERPHSYDVFRYGYFNYRDTLTVALRRTD